MTPDQTAAPVRQQRQVEDLKFGEQFTIWALRAWVHNRTCDPGAEVGIETGFRLANIEPALATFSCFMRMLHTAARCRIDVGCVHSAQLSADEELLLHAASALQDGNHAVAHIILHHYLPCTAVRASVWALEAFVERLLCVSLILRPTAAGRTHVESLAAEAHLPSFALH
jgi:hypothetical protein